MTDETSIPQLDRVAAVLDGLSDATLLELYRTLLPFDNDMIAAAVARRALEGGGGGSLPDGWTQDDSPYPDTVHADTSMDLSPPHDDDIVVLRIRKNTNGNGDFVEIVATDENDVDWMRLYNHSWWMARGDGFRLFFFGDNSEGFPRSWFGASPSDPSGGALDGFGTLNGATHDDLAYTNDSTTGFFVALAPGSVQGLSVELIDPGAPSQGLAISLVDGSTMSVSLATDGGAVITTTLEQIADNLPEDVAALFYVIVTNDGLVAALSSAPLAGGTDPRVTWGTKSGGQEFLNATSPPLDADVVTSQRIQWYDDEEDAPKLRIKERDSAGTLVARISAVLTEDASAFAGIDKPTVPQTIPSIQDVIDALVTLGLVVQSD